MGRSDRNRGVEHLTDYDLVLPTYGTLRRDASYFKDFMFDYVMQSKRRRNLSENSDPIRSKVWAG